MTPLWQHLIDVIHKEVKPALGCTEPIAIALAAAHAGRLLGEHPTHIDVAVSDNLYKNAMGVFVPGTGRIGLPIAAAVGAIGGDPDAGLEVLAGATPENVADAVKLIDAGEINVTRATTNEFIYVHLMARSANHDAEVMIIGSHTGVTLLKKDGEVILEKKLGIQTSDEGDSTIEGHDVDLRTVYDFAMQADFEDIAFILEAKTINVALAQEGLDHEYGLQLGRTLAKQIEEGFLSPDLLNTMSAFTSAASDARMGGATLPAMSNYGSGNQGITATLPVVKMAEFLKSSDEELARALILSHLGAIYIKSHYPPLSAFCGNTATSAAVAMAMVYLKGGTYEQACMAINNVISDTAGMVCDGAKSTCAMKVHTSAQAAFKATVLALSNIGVASQGIISANVEETIDNLGQMVTNGMRQTDEKIIEIMSH